MTTPIQSPHEPPNYTPARGDIVVIRTGEAQSERCAEVFMVTNGVPTFRWVASTKHRTWISAARRLAARESLVRKAAPFEVEHFRAAWRTAMDQNP